MGESRGTTCRERNMACLVNPHLGEGSLKDLVVIYCIIFCSSIEVNLQETIMSCIQLPAFGRQYSTMEGVGNLRPVKLLH